MKSIRYQQQTIKNKNVDIIYVDLSKTFKMLRRI